MALPGQTFTNGVSNFIFGQNAPPNYTTNTFENTPAIQNLVKQAGITLMRVAINDGAADSEINARAQACANAGCAMLVILPHNDLTFNQHMVTLLGNRCNLYELSNEPDLNNITWQQYLSYWNNQIPALRQINPNAAFGGPALGVFSNVSSYLVPWLNGCKTSGVLPDFVSYHEYPCYQISQSACQPKGPNIGNDGASLRTTVTNTLGHAVPIACTEWNIDPTSNPPAYTTQSSFVQPWFQAAYQSFVTNKIDIACCFDVGMGDSYRDMISTSTFQPQADYQPIQAAIQQYLGSGSSGGGGGGGGGGPNPLLVGPDTPIGICQGTKNNAAIPSQFLTDMQAMHVSWLRWQPYANAIETSQGSYNWGALDGNVQACNKAGINLILTVLFPPSWGSSGGVPTPQWTLKFAQAMASRYDGTHGFGKIQGIELGNEDYGFPDDPTSLANTMNYCYPVLKKAYPNLIVGPGAALHRSTSKIQSWFRTLWAKAAGNFDYANFHYYAQNNNSSDPSVDGGSNFMSFPRLLQTMQQTASSAGHKNFPIWITETGWPVNTNYGYASNYLVSQQTQWNYLKYELDQLQGLNQPAKFFVYCLSYANSPPSSGIGTSQGMSLWQNGGPGRLIAFTGVMNYSKNWGSGSSSGGSSGGGGSGGSTTGIHDFRMRAGLRFGSANGLVDFRMRAGLRTTGMLTTRDFKMRAGIAGTTGSASISDTFLRPEQVQWGNASDGGDNWVQAGGTAAQTIVSTPGGQVVASDTFARANRSGFGPASDGETWTVQVGSGTLSISGNEGVIISTEADTDVQLGTQTLADFDLTCRMTIGNYGDIPGIQARFSMSGGNPVCYKLLWYTTKLHINKASGGVNTELASTAFGMDPLNYVWMRFAGSGTHLYGKAWKDGSAEPANWSLTLTDSSVSGPGGFALLGNTASGSSGVKFDHFQAAAYASAGQLTGATGLNTMRLGTEQLSDTELAVRFLVTQSGDIVGLTARDTSLTNFVRLRLASSQVQITEQTPSGGFAVLQSAALSISGSTLYWMKFRVQGTALSGKAWQDGQSEPDWLVSAATNDVTGPGQVGVSATLSASSDVAQFDHFTATVASTSPNPAQVTAVDFAMRAGIAPRPGVPTIDFAMRAGVADLIGEIVVTVYAAREGLILRTFPKS